MASSTARAWISCVRPPRAFEFRRGTLRVTCTPAELPRLAGTNRKGPRVRCPWLHELRLTGVSREQLAAAVRSPLVEQIHSLDLGGNVYTVTLDGFTPPTAFGPGGAGRITAGVAVESAVQVAAPEVEPATAQTPEPATAVLGLFGLLAGAAAGRWWARAGRRIMSARRPS